jgi:CRISPR/Cas system CSM-associated protein Csm4 (group 5 of RAMP superfamily)
MIEDKISLALQEIRKLKQELQGLKKDMRAEEKIDTEEYGELIKTFKDLKFQVKDLEEQWMLQLMRDEQYAKLKEMKVKKDEEIAQANAKLFDAVGKLPPKFFQMNVETEEGPVRVEVRPAMQVYLNGKEEKKRV